MIRLAVAGSAGRMGRCTLETASRDAHFEIAAALTAPRGPLSGRSLRIGERDILVTERLDAPVDVLIDFSSPDGTMAWLDECRSSGIPMVIGVTGHSGSQRTAIRDAADRIAIVKAGNFSIGVQAILDAVGGLVQRLGPEYDVEIVETHHRYKVDAPSGTAGVIVDAIRSAQDPASVSTGGSDAQRVGEIVFGRHGRTGERPQGQIGIHAVRMGEIVGQHEIHFSGPGETITIRHVAHSRETFAAGALRASAWLIGKPPGLYSMSDVLKA